jgi:hypothetical protein
MGGPNCQPNTFLHQSRVAGGFALASSVCVMSPVRSLAGALVLDEERDVAARLVVRRPPAVARRAPARRDALLGAALFVTRFLLAARARFFFEAFLAMIPPCPAISRRSERGRSPAAPRVPGLAPVVGRFGYYRPMALAGGGTVSHYRLLDRLGRGGMGQVWLADDLALPRKVAIKLLTADQETDEQAVARLLREARAAASIDHPNVVTLYEAGLHEGQPFLVMQYIEGETLEARLARGPLTVAEALEMARGIVDALAEVHALGIVHRDPSRRISCSPREVLASSTSASRRCARACI